MMDPSRKSFKLSLLLALMAFALLTMLVVHSAKMGIRSLKVQDIIIAHREQLEGLEEDVADTTVGIDEDEDEDEDNDAALINECLSLTTRAKINLDWLCSVGKTSLRYAESCFIRIIWRKLLSLWESINEKCSIL